MYIGLNFRYCIRREGRAVIADDVGLGKTLQAIAVVCYYREEWPCLVVCPGSMTVAWKEVSSQYYKGGVFILVTLCFIKYCLVVTGSLL